MVNIEDIHEAELELLANKIEDRVSELAEQDPKVDDNSEALIEQAIEYAEALIQEDYHSGKKDDGIVAGCIYVSGLVVMVKITQGTLSDLCNVNNRTIKKHYHHIIEEHTEHWIP